MAVAVLIVAVVCAGCGLPRPFPPHGVKVVTLLDNLGDATTASRIAEDGRNGYGIDFDQSIGLLFHVDRPTVLKEVGGFVQSFPSSALGAADVIVEIHPTLADGRPDRDTVIASAPVSSQQAPAFITYQLAAFNTLLRPGDYYALFALAVQQPPATLDAIAVGSGNREIGPSQSVPYGAPIVTGGVTHPPTYDPSVQQVREPLQIAELVRGSLVPRNRADCTGGKWRDLVDQHGAALHDESNCVSVAAGL